MWRGRGGWCCQRGMFKDDKKLLVSIRGRWVAVRDLQLRPLYWFRSETVERTVTGLHWFLIFFSAFHMVKRISVSVEGGYWWGSSEWVQIFQHQCLTGKELLHSLSHSLFLSLMSFANGLRVATLLISLRWAGSADPEFGDVAAAAFRPELRLMKEWHRWPTLHCDRGVPNEWASPAHRHRRRRRQRLIFEKSL